MIKFHNIFFKWLILLLNSLSGIIFIGLNSKLRKSNLIQYNNYLLIIFLVILTGTFGCKPWNLEERDDHFYSQFGTTQKNTYQGIFMTPDSGCVVLGTLKKNRDTSEIELTKMDHNADILWKVQYPKLNLLNVISLKALDNGFLILYNLDDPATNVDYGLDILDGKGNILSQNQITESGSDDPVIDFNSSDGQNILFLVMHNVFGNNTLFFESYNQDLSHPLFYPEKSGNNVGFNFIQDFNHDIVLLAGNGEAVSKTCKLDLIKIKGDDTTSIMWNITILENASKSSAAFIQTSDSSFFIAAGGIITTGKIYITKVTQTGLLEYQKEIGGTASPDGISLVESDDKGIIILTSDRQIIKTDQAGNIEWHKNSGLQGDGFGNHDIIKIRNNKKEEIFMIAGTLENTFTVYLIDKNGDIYMP